MCGLPCYLLPLQWRRLEQLHLLQFFGFSSAQWDDLCLHDWVLLHCNYGVAVLGLHLLLLDVLLKCLELSDLQCDP